MKLLFLFLTPFCCVVGCKKTTQLPSSIIQHNYFDSTFYKMKEVDTNKVDIKMYKAIFKEISLDTSSRCLLFRIFFSGSLGDELGLYDYKTENFYYWSLDDNNLYEFRKTNTHESQQVYERMKKYINNPEKALENLYGRSRLMDGPGYKLSLITVKSKDLIDVKSFYW